MSIDKKNLRKELHKLGIKTYSKAHASFVRKEDVKKVLKTLAADDGQKDIDRILKGQGLKVVLEELENLAQKLENKGLEIMRSLDSHDPYIEITGDDIDDKRTYTAKDILLHFAGQLK